MQKRAYRIKWKGQLVLDQQIVVACETLSQAIDCAKAKMVSSGSYSNRDTEWEYRFLSAECLGDFEESK